MCGKRSRTELRRSRPAAENELLAQPRSPIVRARLKSGLTQAQFAALLGVSRRTLEQWEQGRRVPSGAAKTLIRVAEKHPEVLGEMAASVACSCLRAANYPPSRMRTTTSSRRTDSGVPTATFRVARLYGRRNGD